MLVCSYSGVAKSVTSILRGHHGRRRIPARSRPPQGPRPRHLPDREAAAARAPSCGWARIGPGQGRGHSDRRHQPRRRHRHRRHPPRPHHRDLRPGVERQDHAHAPSRRQRAEGWAASPPTSTPSTRSTSTTPRSSASTSRICWSRSPTPASRRSRSCEILVRSGAVDIVVIDSVAALVPKAEIEGEMGDCHVGLQARLMSQALRKLAGAINRSNTRRGLHQPAAREDRRHVRQPRDDHRRQGAQVLRLAPARHPPHRPGQGARDGRRLPRPGEGGQEQGRAAVPAGRVRHHVRRGHQPHLAAGGHRRRGQHHPEVGRVVLLQRPAHRAGPRERQAVPRATTRRSWPRSRAR